MSSEPLSDERVIELLSRLRGDGCTQVYLFGPSGEPFWAARLPLDSEEIPLLADAMDLVASVDADHAKPFAAGDARGRFVVGALDASEDLYLVLIGPQSVGAALDDARSAIAPHAAGLRARVSSGE